MLGLVLFAQAIPTGAATDLVSIFGTTGTAAVLIWYVVYDVRVRTPNMMTIFSKELSEMRTAFEREQDESRKNSSLLIEGLRQTFINEQVATRNVFTTEQVATRSRHEQEMSAFREMLFENMKTMRGAVHDVRDTANALMMKQANELHP